MPLSPVLVTLPEGGRFGAAMRSILSEDVLCRVVDRLKCINWREARRDFYRQREENVTDDPVFRDIFGPETRRAMAATVGMFFEDDIDPDFDVAAHRMIRGDYIAPHTDENDFGERYRLTVTLNEHWNIQEGGILLILKGADIRSIFDAWLPTLNNGFLFKIGPDSFHAVTPVTSDRARLSLIFTFKSREEFGRSQAAIARSWYPFPWDSDLRQAAFNAGLMGISFGTFQSPYRLLCFASAADLTNRLGALGNMPSTLSYSTCAAINVDENGRQPKGSDAARVADVAGFDRLPLITIVRRTNGQHVLANGSHRLSHAVNRGLPIAASIFSEI
jgi:hypothetical protein